jgi:transcriptional regulator with XRE-family HTH domain
MEQAARAAGVHRATLYRWEQGETQPRLAELEGLLLALRASTEQTRHALALMDVPRARARVQSEISQISVHVGIGPMPDGGALLQTMRLRRGLSREAVAARIGVTTRTLRRWEDGDVWPPAERLHTLCYALHAHKDEVVALTTGVFAPGPGGLASSSADLVERYDAFRSISSASAEEETLRDLRFLTFEAQAWAMATRQDAARGLLADMYAQHAQHCSIWGRYHEAGEKADRALEIGAAAGLPPALLARAAIVGARAAVYRGERPLPKRGLERLRVWSGRALPPEFHAWLLSDIAHYLALEGQDEAAVDIAGAARHVAEEALPIEQALRRLDEIKVLVHVGRTGSALERLFPVPAEFARIRVQYALMGVKALRMVGDDAAAHALLSEIALQADTSALEAHDRTVSRAQEEAQALWL